MPELYRLLQSVGPEGRTVSKEQLPFAEFLRAQGLLSLTPPARAVAEFAPHRWDQGGEGVYEMLGDGEGGSWRYHYQSGQACPGCLWRWWVLRHHGPDWLDRLQHWPDFQLSWPIAESAPPTPEPGWIHYRRNTRCYRGQVFARPGCACRCFARWPRHWGSWAHPVSGPFQKVVERHNDGLWRVSLELPPAQASGAHAERRRARAAAAGEACERWAAWQPPAEKTVLVRALSGSGRRRCSTRLISLQASPSHGLACGPNLKAALAAGFWELLERDAVRLWWRAWHRGRPWPVRRHATPDGWLWSIPARYGRAFIAFHGRDGCGAWGSGAGPQGAARAVRESAQNFALLKRRPPLPVTDCHQHDDHAAWAWHEPVPRWKELAELKESPLSPALADWRAAARVLAAQGRPLYAVRLPCFWADRLGWVVVRVLSPALRGLDVGGTDPPHPFA